MIAGKFDWGTLYGNITMICVNKKLLKKQVIQKKKKKENPPLKKCIDQ
jgi:hypothetical protein